MGDATNGASLAGFTVYADLKNDSNLDTGDPSATTDASGNYELTGLSPGVYTLRIVPHPGWRQTFSTGDGSQAVSVATGATSGINFSVTQLGSLLGTVFNDANGDGILNAHESSLAGWQVYLDLAGTGTFVAVNDPVTTTDAWGNFSFGNLSAGTYTVRIIPQPGWTATTANSGSYTITLTHGGIVGGLLIGEQSS